MVWIATNLTYHDFTEWTIELLLCATNWYQIDSTSGESLPVLQYSFVRYTGMTAVHVLGHWSFGILPTSAVHSLFLITISVFITSFICNIASMRNSLAFVWRGESGTHVAAPSVVMVSIKLKRSLSVIIPIVHASRAWFIVFRWI